jgi:hypothetical protein
VRELEPIAVNAAAAAKLLGLGERLVRELAKKGEIPCIDLTEDDGTDHDRMLFSVEALRRWALERSGYAAPLEVRHGEAPSEPGRGQAVSAKPGQALGRGRPRSGASAPVPLRPVGG